jgi:hypothetical protein
VSDCRSCGAAIRWAVTATGKRIPLDPEPVDGGNIVIDNSGPHGPIATVVGKATQPGLFGDDSPRYVSHFATCPNADRHRRR